MFSIHIDQKVGHTDVENITEQLDTENYSLSDIIIIIIMSRTISFSSGGKHYGCFLIKFYNRRQTTSTE